jgi:putative hemolysin
MAEIGTEILIIILLLLINGVLAMSEAALISSRRVRLQQRANEGDEKAEAALKLLSTPNLFLSTVQIGITLVGVLSGAVGGASIVDSFHQLLQKLQPLLRIVNHQFSDSRCANNIRIPHPRRTCSQTISLTEP